MPTAASSAGEDHEGEEDAGAARRSRSCAPRPPPTRRRRRARPWRARSPARRCSEICVSIGSIEIEPSSWIPSSLRSAMTTLASSRATSARITSPSGRRAAPGRWTTLQTDGEPSSSSSAGSACSAGVTIRRWIIAPSVPRAGAGRSRRPRVGGRSAGEELLARRDRRVREVREQAVDAERVEQLVLRLRDRRRSRTASRRGSLRNVQVWTSRPRWCARRISEVGRADAGGRARRRRRRR